MHSARLAFLDIWTGFVRHHLWRTVAWNEIRQRYRRSFIGPFWLTLSMGIMVGALGFLYAGLLRQPTEEYIPYLAVGLILWTFISSIIMEGCTVFINAAGIMRQIAIPLTVHVYTYIWRHVIILIHNFVIYIIVAIIFELKASFSIFLLLPALILYIVNAVWIGVFFGILCARFRDITMMIGSLVQIMFFFTPVIWMPEIIPDRQWVVQYNPAFHFIEIARAPLLGYVPTWQNWIVSVSLTFVGIGMAFELFRRYRPRVVYWA